MICDECETVAHCMKNGCVPKTNKKNEALKLALAVLKEWRKGFPNDWTDFDTEAITAIREALAEESSDTEQPAQPQQEPVAWRVKVETKLRDGSVDFGYQLRNERLSKYDEPLYTSPPAQRKPLTDEEIMKVWQPVAKRMYGIVAEGHSMDVLGIRNESMVLSLSRAIEAAHGIKENA